MEPSTIENNMNTLPSPPFIVVSGIPNFRDIGGYALTSSSSQSIKQGLIYRCGDPGRVTEDGINTVKVLGITHVYDIRSLQEIQKSQSTGRNSQLVLPATRVFCPVFSDADYSPEAIAVRYKNYSTGSTGGFTQAYTDILEAGSTSYRSILLHLAHAPESPLLVHCTAGKDRTGVICALILSACGVDDNTVAYEYSLTEIGLANYKEILVKHLMANPALKGNRAGALNMLSSIASNMLATLKMIREIYGGAEGYFIHKCKLTLEEIEKIRQNLVVNAKSVIKIPLP